MPRALLFVLVSSALLAAAKPAPGPPARELKAYHAAWKRAVEDYRDGKYKKAVHRLEHMKGGDSLSAPPRWGMLASARLRAGDTAGADSALAAALAASRDAAWIRHFHRRRLATAAVLAPEARRDYYATALGGPLEDPIRAEFLYRLLEIDTAAAWTARAPRLRVLLPLALPEERLRAQYREFAARAPDSAWEAQRLLLDLEEKLELWNEAMARAARMLPPGPESARSLEFRVALLAFRKGAHEESIRRYRDAMARYGENAEALIQIARAYRALSRDSEARAAYERLVARFPQDPLSAETLWMRAFDDESLGRVDSALAGYGRILRDFPRHARSGEARLRMGFIQSRRGEHAAAAQTFAALRGEHRPGRINGAARYWEGRALANAPGDTALPAAIAVWTALAREYPFGHYGHAARAELVRRGALPDSLAWQRMLNWNGEADTRAWLDSAAGGASAALPPESRWLSAEDLFALGLDTLAVVTLQARAESVPASLWLLYDAAVRCRTAGFDYEAYRFGLKLSDKLPLARWPAAPVGVLRLFYPSSYASLANPASARAGLPPYLALALIKQESGFDPNAVSRVGARGLMQIMPATGAELARKEGRAGFQPDSLFVPAVNVRLGVAYLKELLRRHDGNITLTLAHYNAGPTALVRWMPRLAGRSHEEMAEDIGYAETREYVKRVEANRRTYEVLWEGEIGNQKSEIRNRK